MTAQETHFEMRKMHLTGQLRYWPWRAKCWRPVGHCPGMQHSKRMPDDAVAVVADIAAVVAAAVCLNFPEIVPELAAGLADVPSPDLASDAASSSLNREEKTHSHG